MGLLEKRTLTNSQVIALVIGIIGFLLAAGQYLRVVEKEYRQQIIMLNEKFTTEIGSVKSDVNVIKSEVATVREDIKEIKASVKEMNKLNKQIIIGQKSFWMKTYARVK